jgi:type II secretory pathway pseudopilin PulG
MRKRLRIRKAGDRGFSLIELMFAVFVLGTAVIGSMFMVVIGIGRNGSNRMDTTATNVAQTVLEDIAGAPPPASPGPGLPAPPPAVLPTITDCTGNALLFTTAVGGAPLSPSGNGDIDFQNPAPAAYQVNYTVCGTNGLRAVYDVRWRIDPVDAAGFAHLITVAARQPMAVRNGTLVYIPPVTLRTIVGQ